MINLRTYTKHIKEGECFQWNNSSFDPMDLRYWILEAKYGAFHNYLITLWVKTDSLIKNHQELVKCLNKEL